jgi:hypothetical protein
MHQTSVFQNLAEKFQFVELETQRAIRPLEKLQNHRFEELCFWGVQNHTQLITCLPVSSTLAQCN